MMAIKHTIQGYTCTIFCRYNLWIIFLLSLFTIGNLSAQQSAPLSQHDGPYILYTADQTKQIRVYEGQLEIQQNSTPTFEVISENGEHRFQVALHPIETPKATYSSNNEILVLSDPHGDFDSFHAILKAHRVIGEQYQWTFDKKHLVVIGDIFDRGEDVLPLFWLLYKLEAEASAAGGAVHFLLGNHEEMILRGNLKYAKEKYKTLASQLGKNYEDLWGADSELGRWLISRNTIEKIGDNLFVHAGLSADLIGDVWSMDAINDSTRAYIHQKKEEREQSPAARFLFGSNGPLWYRGMVRTEEKYNPLSVADLQHIMDQYRIKRIFLGHTIFPEVSSFYEGRVYGVNVSNKSNRDKGHSRGLLIKGNKRYRIYDDPKKKERI
ncbi:metallophosphoesterase [Sphingobacterium yanglingense]|nr:metallophosphoesterase [Sphingobacterium yanglingense]